MMLDDQVLLTAKLASALKLALPLHILSHRRRDEDIAIAVASSQLRISSVIRLDSRHGLPADINVVEPDRSRADLVFKAVGVEGIDGSVASGV